MDRVNFWLNRIDKVLDNTKLLDSRKKSLSDIKHTIKQTNEVTDAQVRAIKNLQNGKNPITND